MSLDWWAQRRRVRAIAEHSLEAVRRERALRARLGREGRELATSHETILWAGVTGFLFLHRRAGEDDEEQHSMIIDLGLSALAVGRLRTLPRRIEQALERARMALRGESGGARAGTRRRPAA